MNESKTKLGTGQPVIAMLREGAKLKGIELQQKRGTLEVIWAKTTENADSDWPSFAAECGVSTESTTDAPAKKGSRVVVGFSSAGTVFHRASMPSVDSKELASIVQFQAETRLPLPADQTELAWRVAPSHNGQMDVTMAVARKQLLRRFADDVRCLNPIQILLDCEAMVKAWATVFSEPEEKAILVSMGPKNTQVCLVENERLSNAVNLDSGLADFSVSAQAPADTTEPKRDALLLDSGLDGFSVDEETQDETTERFAQDIRSVIDFFGLADDTRLPVLLLSDNSDVYARIVSTLKLAQVCAREATPDVQRLSLPGDAGMACVHEYRVAIGLGLMGLDRSEEALNLFKNVYQPADKAKKKRRFFSPKLALALASVMLLGLLIVSYTLDRKSPQAIKERVEASTAGMNTTLDALVERQTLIKTVARERPDMLALLKLVSASGEQGIMLHSLNFKKGQKVTITGQVQKDDQLYKFHEKLREHKDLAEVTIMSTGKVSGKGKGITFTITFQYKNFGKKTRTAS